MTASIIYPSINLFLYDLREGLGQDDGTVAQNRRIFARKLYGNLAEDLLNDRLKSLQQRETPEAEYLELLETRTLPFEDPEDGQYYPVQLGDTYGLVVDYSGKLNPDSKANDSPQAVQLNPAPTPFYPLKKTIEERLCQQTGSIGQTWLLFGKLADANADILEVAKDSYAQIVPNPKWERDFIGENFLLGGTLYELNYFPFHSGLNWEECHAKSYHILVWLFPHDVDPDVMRASVKSLYFDFLRLFHYRHKVTWCYAQGRHLMGELKTEFIYLQKAVDRVAKIPDTVESGQLNLKALEKTLAETLKTLADYTIKLNYLDAQIRTLKMNSNDYEIRLNQIEASHQWGDLTSLMTFRNSEKYAKRYQQQLENDYNFLSPGLTILQNLTSTIGGIIDLEKARNDRALNNTVAIAGVGLAVSGVAVSVATSDNSPTSYKDITFLAAPAFWLSLAVGAIAAILVLGLMHLRRR
ncbi:MAG: hypothetical protein WBC69_19255 [Geitlerinemataceae cyanobacterium]